MARERLQLRPGLRGALWLHEPRGRIHPRHRHDELELNLVLSGTARYLLEGRVYELRPRSLVWLFPAQEHILVDLDHDLRMWILCIHPDLLRPHCRAPPWTTLLEPDPAQDVCRSLSVPLAAEVDDLLGRIAGGPHDPALFNAALVHATLHSWHAHCSAERAPAPRRPHPAVAAALERLHAGDERDLPALSAACGLSYSRLSRLFRAQLGVGLVDYRNRRRLERFLERRRRRGDEATMLADALAAGFGSYAQFHRVFRAELGCTPREWLAERAASAAASAAPARSVAAHRGGARP